MGGGCGVPKSINKTLTTLGKAGFITQRCIYKGDMNKSVLHAAVPCGYELLKTQQH